MKSLRHHPHFLYGLHLLLHRRVHSILLIMMALLLAFAAFDYLLLPERFGELLPLRLLAAVAGGALLLLNRIDRRGRFSRHIAFFSYLCVSGVILFIIWRQGAGNAAQHVGLMIVVTAYIILAPLTLAQTLACGLPLVFAYYLVVFVFGDGGRVQAPEVINNLFFIFTFVLVAATQSWAENKLRIQEFQVRRNEKNAARMLRNRAHELEKEAQRRGREQQVAEQRYRTLYESISDAVVLIDAQGRIIQANGAWFIEAGEGKSLFGQMMEDDCARMRHELLDPLLHGETVADWQARLRASDGRLLDVEINGVLLLLNGRKIGLQLVIRDIGARKALERQLYESLDKVRKMEDMTILALAKISEYRDASPGQHLERIREYSRTLAVALAATPPWQEIVTPLYIQMLCQGALLHDIGKVAVADEILTKKTPLSEEEEQHFRQHTVFGGNFISGMKQEGSAGSFLSLAHNIALFHHEHWDGGGYPEARCGAAIPLEARIVALAHAYEDLSITGRLSHSQAAQRIIDAAGTQFDPLLVQLFAANHETFAAVFAQFAETGGGAGSEPPGDHGVFFPECR